MNNVDYPYLRELKNAVVSVINDLVTDQRVHKHCVTLQKLGFDVLLVGRRQKKSGTPDPRSYRLHRMNLIFQKGPLFYLSFNFRLFLFLLFSRTDLLVSNDLDTLAANYLVSVVKKKPLVYDTHELFTEVPELQNSPVKKAIWSKLEKSLLPRLKSVFTVNNSIANWYRKKYGIAISVVRNIPSGSALPLLKDRVSLGLPTDKKIIIFQGAGINVDRGGEELVQSMRYTKDILLLIVGSGDVIPQLKITAGRSEFSDKIRFIEKLPYPEMMQYTRNADLGLSLDKASNMNYRYSLPNKVFDYIHAGIPILASRLPEIESLINTYAVGDFIDSHEPVVIAEKINELFGNPNRLATFKKNCRLAAIELTWEKEEKELIRVYEKFN